MTADVKDKVTEDAEITPSKYKLLTSEFTDLDDVEREESFRFTKPGRKEVARLATAPKSKQADVMCKVLTSLVHPDEAEAFKKIVKDEQLLALSFGDQLMKACGAGSVRLGKLDEIRADYQQAVLVYSDLIKYWLRIEPADDLDEFVIQAARALNMEERFHEQAAAHLSKVFAASE